MSITERQVGPYQARDPRRLSVDFLHYPRSFRAAHFFWDLDKGFRLEVLGRAVFWMSLLDSAGVTEPVVCRPQGREQDFLLHVSRNCQGVWPSWDRSRLGPHTVCVVLSQDGRPVRPPRDWPNLVLWVRQDMPAGTRWTGNDFFTPEQILYQWGRVGRRVKRRARWRGFLPW